MLEPPPIPHQEIIDRLRAEYGLECARLAFLPIGADVNTAVYRADISNGAPCFLKLRKGAFDPGTVEVPLLLKTRGSAAIRAATIAPLETLSGRLWGELGPFRMILYPFVEGQDGYQAALSERQWVEYGAALRGLHDMALPKELAMRIPRESFSPSFRDQARMYLDQALAGRFDAPAASSDAKGLLAVPAASSDAKRLLAVPAASSDAQGLLAVPVAARLAAFMRERRDTIAHMLDRCDRLGEALRARIAGAGEAPGLEFVLCHADVHPGNLHLAPEGALYLVDWDNVIFAPKERDLMSIGAGMDSDRGQGEALFYSGYCRSSSPASIDRAAQIDRAALAYYRYERIIEDFAAYGDQLLASTEGGADREQSYEYFLSNFRPGGVIEVAFRTDSYWIA
jgi:spectinomycin phosphotransferase